MRWRCRGERASERDARLQAAVLAQEQIETDLRRLLVEPGASPVAVGAGGDALAFWAFAVEEKEAADFPARPPRRVA